MNIHDVFRRNGVLLLILACAAVLRLYGLGTHSFWYDEVMLDNRGLTQLHPVSRFLDQRFLVDNHDYLMIYNHGFVNWWQRLFGDGEWPSRLSSVIFALLGIYFLYRVTDEVAGKRPAVFAAVLAAFSPFHIHYSQEFRQYAAVGFLTMVAFWAYLLIIRTGRLRYWIWYALSMIAGVYFHYMTAITLLTFAVLFALRSRKQRGLRLPAAVTHAVIFAVMIPFILTLYANVSFILANRIGPMFSEFPTWYGERAGFFNLANTAKIFAAGYYVELRSFTGEILSVLFFGFFCAGIFRGRKNRELYEACSLLMVTVAVIFGISLFKMCYMDRYFFGVFNFYLMGAACGISALGRRTGAVVLLLLGLLTVPALANYYADRLPVEAEQHCGVDFKYDAASVSGIIAGAYEPGDLIVHSCKKTVFPLKFYTGKMHPPAPLIAESEKGRVVFFDGSASTLSAVAYNAAHPLTILPGQYRAFDAWKNSTRVWVIFSRWYDTDAMGAEGHALKAWFVSSGFALARQEVIDNVLVCLFTK